jgi:FtsP/CotA-like multicopper oxidase with cupredoxin domain
MLMGRFGNRFLVNGEPSYELAVARGEVVRFFFTNASNTRTFNVSFQREAGPARSSRREYAAGRAMQAVPEAPLPIKVVGSDIGKFEREQMVESVVIAPAERYIVEVRFDEPGEVHLNNQVQAINHLLGTFFPEVDTLGVIRVAGVPVVEDHGPAFDLLRENADVIGDIDSYRGEFDRPVDLELLLTLEVSGLPLPVEQMMMYDWIYFNPVEWGDTMPMMNWQSTGNEIAWILREPATGADNDQIDWRFRVGDVVKVRLRNERDAFHAMQHPLHIHGQRFLVLEQDGVPNPNLVWKDTVLLAAGSTTDILLELSNPGRWMVHCHIAEHLESGMKFVFEVEPGAAQQPDAPLGQPSTIESPPGAPETRPDAPLGGNDR